MIQVFITIKAHYATTDYTTSATQRYPTEVSPSVQDYYPYVSPTAVTSASTADGGVGQAYNVNITNSYTYYTAQQYATHPHGQSVSSAVHHPLSTPNLNLGVGTLPQPDTSSDGQKDDKDGNPTYDWMKIRRNPPKTTRKYNFYIMIFIQRIF